MTSTPFLRSTLYADLTPARVAAQNFALMPSTARELESYLVYGYLPMVDGQPSIELPGQLQMLDDETFVAGAPYRVIQTPGYPFGELASTASSQAGPGQPVLVEETPPVSDAQGLASRTFTMRGTGTAFVTLMLGDSRRSMEVIVYASTTSRFLKHTLPAALGRIKKTRPREM